MENADLEKFKERIRSEANLFHEKSPFQKGYEDGEREALNCSYAFFMRYEKAFREKKDLNNFTTAESEELYSLAKSRQKTKMIRVDRIEGGQGIEGVYRLTEEKNYDPLEEISEEEKSEYLKGWIGGIHKICKIYLTVRGELGLQTY